MELRKTAKAPALLLIALILALSMCSALPAGSAFAEIRQDDMVGGRAASEIGISASAFPSVNAERVYVVDDDGVVYFERNSDERANIASITKIMTAIIALEYGDPDMEIVVSERAASVGESTSGLMEGDVLSLDDAIAGLMVPSGNDAAIALAESVGKIIIQQSHDSDDEGDASENIPGVGDGNDPGSYGDDSTAPSPEDDPYQAFVDAMNEKALELGCEDTVFANPHGLDEDEFEDEMYSTAHDVSVIAQYAMGMPLFKKTVGSGDTAITVERDGEKTELDLISTDLLLDYYDGAAGIKTGYTDKAGYCFAGASIRDGKTLYAVVLDSSDEFRRFDDAENLFEWVYGSLAEIPAANTEQTYELQTGSGPVEVPVIAWVAHQDWDDVSFPVTLENPEAVIEASSIMGNVSQDVVIEVDSGDIEAGDVVGRIDFYQQNEIIMSEELIACDSVSSPSLLDSLYMGWQRMIGAVDDSSRAQTEVFNSIPPILQKS